MVNRITVPFTQFWREFTAPIESGIESGFVKELEFHHNGVVVRVNEEDEVTHRYHVPSWFYTGMTIQFLPPASQKDRNITWPKQAFGEEFLENHKDIISYVDAEPGTRSALDF